MAAFFHASLDLVPIRRSRNPLLFCLYFDVMFFRKIFFMCMCNSGGKRVKSIFGVVMVWCMCWSAHAESIPGDAGLILSKLQPQLFRLVAYTPEELNKLSPDFQDYYRTDIAPRLDDIAEHISPSAMHWIDIDGDTLPELICWTEGLAPTGWGAKEHLLIIKAPEIGAPSILLSRELNPEPSRGSEVYKYVRFMPHPNKGRGNNEHVAAVFSYAQYGGSGAAYCNFESGWNRYEETVYIDRFLTAFPVAVDYLSD